LCLGGVNVCAGRITVVFRFDDYSARSNTAMEARLIQAFRKCHACCTFGVIPYVWDDYGRDPRPQDVIPLTVEKAALLRDAMDQGIVDVAMHSFSHQRTGPWTEFAGRNYHEQLEKIRQGRDLLVALLGRPVTTFAPAWNSYDDVTVQVLREQGFACLSADIGGRPGLQPSCPLKFLPSGCDLDHLREAVERARRAGDADALIVVLFHM
jgi:peptidoglycan/xylan/chitin deacetylase (PgdA/CDA1 family)